MLDILTVTDVKMKPNNLLPLEDYQVRKLFSNRLLGTNCWEKLTKDCHSHIVQ